MKHSPLTDFYRGWAIEVMPSVQGFQAVCYSPCRKQLVVETRHLVALDALHGAKQEIDYQLACISLAGALREFYEVGHLNFEEWHSLHHSLHHPLAAN
jgi:hypothetical protein